MNITELNGEERLALTALMKTIVLADGVASPEEHQWLVDVVDELGADTYRAALTETDRRFPDEETLKTFLAATGSKEARDVIYGTLLGAATANSMVHNELALLDWLAETWQIKVQFEGLPDDEERDD